MDSNVYTIRLLHPECIIILSLYVIGSPCEHSEKATNVNLTVEKNLFSTKKISMPCSYCKSMCINSASYEFLQPVCEGLL